MQAEMNGSTKRQLTTTNGRTIKFTPERLEQIQNLVERGLNRQQIAEMIGVTVGSLQVTCSRLGISLRRQRAPVIKPRDRAMTVQLPPDLRPAIPKPPEHANAQPAKFALQIEYQGRERTIALPLSQNLLGALAMEAHFANMSIGEMIAKLIATAINALDEPAQPLAA
jgi:hypothetical protein